MDDVIAFVGARGGQGTSTVAATAALHAATHCSTSLLCADPLATAALLGAPPVLPGESLQIAPNLTLADLDGPRRAVTIIDAGTLASGHHARQDARTVVVIRGPGYLSLHTAVSQPDFRPDAAVVVAELGRAYSEHDVAEVLDVPVVATIDVRPRIATVMDAGLLMSRATTEAALRPLRDAVDRLLPHLTHRLDVQDTQPAGRRTAVVDLTDLDLEVGR